MMAPYPNAPETEIVDPARNLAAGRSREQYGRAVSKRMEFVPADRREAVAKRAADMPASQRPNYIVAASGRASPRDAIKAHCLECMGWDRSAVAGCTDLACSLYAYRPS